MLIHTPTSHSPRHRWSKPPSPLSTQKSKTSTVLAQGAKKVRPWDGTFCVFRVPLTTLANIREQIRLHKSVQAHPGTGWKRHGSGRRHYGEVFGEGLWIETYSWEAKVTLFISTSRGSWLPGSLSHLSRPLFCWSGCNSVRAFFTWRQLFLIWQKTIWQNVMGNTVFSFPLFFFLFHPRKNERIKKKERALWKVLIHQKTRVKREQYAPFWLFSSPSFFSSFFPWCLEMWRNVFWSALTEPGPWEEGG